MPDRSLDSLSPEFRPLAVELLARLVERGVMVMIVQTGRTEAEHASNLASGASHVSRSKHLPRVLRGIHAHPDKADAMDICPYAEYDLYGPDKLAWEMNPASNKDEAAWNAIGEIAEDLGLRWGGRWSQPYDPGHVELLFPLERYKDIPMTSSAFDRHGIVV